MPTGVTSVDSNAGNVLNSNNNSHRTASSVNLLKIDFTAVENAQRSQSEPIIRAAIKFGEENIDTGTNRLHTMIEMTPLGSSVQANGANSSHEKSGTSNYSSI